MEFSQQQFSDDSVSKIAFSWVFLLQQEDEAIAQQAALAQQRFGKQQIRVPAPNAAHDVSPVIHRMTFYQISHLPQKSLNLIRMFSFLYRKRNLTQPITSELPTTHRTKDNPDRKSRRVITSEWCANTF